MSTAAIVVTYFPEEALLVRLLNCICSDVQKVYVIDNTPAATIDWLISDWFIERKRFKWPKSRRESDCDDSHIKF